MSDILKSLTSAQSDKLKADVGRFVARVQELKDLDPSVITHAHSVLEKHKIMKNVFGYRGGVAGVHKLMAK